MGKLDFSLRASNFRKWGMYLITIGIFYFPRAIRIGLLSSINNLNIIPAIGLILLVVNNRGIKLRYYAILLLMSSIVYITEYMAELLKVSMFMTLTVNLLLPMLLLFINDYKLKKEEAAFCIKLMNIAVYITIAAGLCNYVGGNAIANAVAQFTKDEFYIGIANSSRLFTWYGHYLYSGEIFLIFYCVNATWHRVILKKKESIAYFIISLLAILLVGSKVCSALILSIYILLNIQRLRYVIAGLTAVIILYYMGFFDLLFARLGGDTLSTGRVESLQYLTKNIRDLFPWFIGHGTNYIYQLRKIYAMASAGLEFVLLMFAAYFGRIFAIIFALVCFIRPIALALKSRSKIAVIAIAVIILDVNSYNGLANFQDQMYTYCWFIAIMMLINQLSVNKERNDA